MKPTMMALIALALAGCGEKQPENGTGTPVINEEAAENAAIAANMSLTATGKPVVAAQAPVPALAFPPAFLGRWGVVEADCDVARQDNKGLLVVEPAALRFYESRAKLTAITDATQHKFTADLDFSGEGQKWKTRETYELVAGNTAILRTMPSPRETLRYKRC